MKISTDNVDKKCERLRKWHKKFVFFPRKIDNSHYFLCYLMRKYSDGDNSYMFGRLGYYKYLTVQSYITAKLKGN